MSVREEIWRAATTRNEAIKQLGPPSNTDAQKGGGKKKTQVSNSSMTKSKGRLSAKARNNGASAQEDEEQKKRERTVTKEQTSPFKTEGDLAEIKKKKATMTLKTKKSLRLPPDTVRDRPRRQTRQSQERHATHEIGPQKGSGIFRRPRSTPR